MRLLFAAVVLVGFSFNVFTESYNFSKVDDYYTPEELLQFETIPNGFLKNATNGISIELAGSPLVFEKKAPCATPVLKSEGVACEFCKGIEFNRQVDGNQYFTVQKLAARVMEYDSSTPDVWSFKFHGSSGPLVVRCVEDKIVKKVGFEREKIVRAMHKMGIFLHVKRVREATVQPHVQPEPPGGAVGAKDKASSRKPANKK